MDESAHTLHAHGRKNPWRDRIVLVEDWAWPRLVPVIRDELPDAILFVEENGALAIYRRALGEHRRSLKVLGLNARYTMHDS